MNRSETHFKHLASQLALRLSLVRLAPRPLKFATSIKKLHWSVTVLILICSALLRSNACINFQQNDTYILIYDKLKPQEANAAIACYVARTQIRGKKTDFRPRLICSYPGVHIQSGSGLKAHKLSKKVE